MTFVASSPTYRPPMGLAERMTAVLGEEAIEHRPSPHGRVTVSGGIGTGQAEVAASQRQILDIDPTVKIQIGIQTAPDRIKHIPNGIQVRGCDGVILVSIPGQQHKGGKP